MHSPCNLLHFVTVVILSRFRWPRGLRHGSVVTRLPGLRVRIPPGAWISVSRECCVLLRRSLCDEPCVSMSVIRRNNNRQQQTEEVRLRQKQRNTKLTFSRITPRVVFSQRRKACGHKLNKIHYGTGRKEKKEKRRCGPHNMTHYRPVNETGTQSVTREFFISSTSRHSGCYHSLSVSIRKYELVPRILA